MNEYQKVCCRAYGNDAPFAWMAEDAHAQNWRANIRDCGDTLFSAIMVELATEEGCDSYDEADQRANRMLGDVGDVYNAIQEMVR